MNWRCWLNRHELRFVGVNQIAVYWSGTQEVCRRYTAALQQCARCNYTTTLELKEHWTLEQLQNGSEIRVLEKMLK
jgi:hypothetical protein